jgi:hypothetical protein
MNSNFYLEGTRAGDNSLDIDSVDQGFLDGKVLDGRVIESINIVPVYKTHPEPNCVNTVRYSIIPSWAPLTSNLFILVITILNSSNVHGGLVREDHTAWSL